MAPIVQILLKYVELETVFEEVEHEDDINSSEYLPGVDFEFDLGEDESYEQDDN